MSRWWSEGIKVRNWKLILLLFLLDESISRAGPLSPAPAGGGVGAIFARS